ncbi:transcription-repair coupling factor [Ilyomonas limi]|uniref:Transcription-repair-coupling factor n=1 Tax=Ilyomonas limi TaxID=2575867 RepID=A0A4U3KQK9_9BACT|nr:transcription-repair coupling factor [Ilyomonas limi]TKK64635.1 transcription-repair coupling factor [Ilyomonas limi]
MNLHTLLQQYQNEKRVIQLTHQLSFAPTDQSSEKVFLKNLQGSSAEFMVASVFAHPNTQSLNHLVVLNDAEEAAYFQNTLENLTSALDLFYFPSSFKNRKNFRLLNSSHVMLRTEALTKLSAGGNKKIVVTYPEALFEKVVLPKTLSGNIINIKVNDTISLESLLELFSMYGFVRSDFVYEPGQYALRGGILDIYSFGNEKPYRVELFGNEVDSIRIFDPETQLSERKLLQVSIIPNVETQFETGDKVSLLEFLPENTIVWLKDWDVIKEKIEVQEEDLGLYLERTKAEAEHLKEESERLKKEGFTKKAAALLEGENEEEDETTILKEVSLPDFSPAATIERQIQQRHIVEFGYKPQFAVTEIEFNTKSQPSFNRQFDLLITNLKAHEAAKYSIYIFAEQAKQLERLHSIFTDLKTEIQFVPVATSIHEGFIDEDLKIVCYTDHQIFQRYHKYRVKQAYNKNKALTLKTLRDLQPGDFVTHIDHGVGTYSGLQKIEVAGRLQEAVRIIYKGSDILYVNINSLHKISKYTGKEGTEPKINKLGSDVWNKLKEKTKTKVKEIAFDLIKLYAQRKAQHGFAYAPDNYMQSELEASFIYEDTPDQAKAVADVKKDMEQQSPMDRLVCGDVGFGKTEVAIRAAFKAVLDGKQVAVLVPTTILAFQHYKTFEDRLKEFPVSVDYVNRFKSSKEKKETYQKVADGKVDIIVGTHALLSKDVKFKDLGLMIIDEEQKFGVAHKEKLKTLKTNVDCLTLTATPIPRTLHFSLMGARDLSIINTPPPNRQPIQTEVQVFNLETIRDAIYYETERGGQVFFIHNRVQGLPEMAAMIQAQCPDLSISYAHGQMEGDQLEEKILDFIDRKYDVLVCTNIVESGVDIPNVNTIIVNNAHHFGLSDLHQLRGRVGRSNKKAFCYLLAPPMSTLPTDSRKRLQTLEQFSELGSGFQIAMRDLDIRGAGNLLGGEQSGFMAEIGFEMYQKILDEAVRELKRTSFKDLFKEEISKQDDYVTDCTIDTDLEILIPDDYVESITERLSLYTRLDNCEDERELQAFHAEMQDRFGPMPKPVEDLFTTVRCRRLAIDLGFEKMSLKDNTLRCYFINRPDSPYFESDLFKRILDYLQTGTNKARLKQAGKNFLLISDDVKDMNDMHRFLKRMHTEVIGVSAESVVG